jgi:hypothetical protein
MAEALPILTASLREELRDWGPARDVVIDYTNYRGERSERRISPMSIGWGSNQWHPERQWLLSAVDIKKGEIRQFAVKDIHSWRPAGEADQ